MVVVGCADVDGSWAESCEDVYGCDDVNGSVGVD